MRISLLWQVCLPLAVILARKKAYLPYAVMAAIAVALAVFTLNVLQIV